MNVKSIMITQPDEPELLPADIVIDGEPEVCESCGYKAASYVTAELPEDMFVSECLACFLQIDWTKIELVN